MSQGTGTTKRHTVPFSAEMLAILVILLLAGVIAFITFRGVVSSLVNSASNNPGNVSAPVIDYGE